MFSNKLNYKIINFTALMLLLYIGFSNIGMWWGILCKIFSITLPFIIAFAFAYAISPFIKILLKKGFKKPLVITIISVATIFILVSLVVITLPLIYDQLVTLSKNLVPSITDLAKRFNLNIGSFEVSLEDSLSGVTKNLGNIVSKGTIKIVNTSLSFAGQFLVGFITWIYFMADMDNIKEKVKEFTKSISNKTFRYVKSLDDELGNYIKGLVIFMIIQLFEYSILFFLVGHPNWLLLGILACITTVIPYFGGLITNVIGIITASVVSTPVLIGTIIICLIFPQLDGYVISPKIYGKTNNVNPLITIIVVSIGGSLAGVFGIVIALPVYLLIRATYNFFKKDLEKEVKKIKKTI